MVSWSQSLSHSLALVFYISYSSPHCSETSGRSNWREERCHLLEEVAGWTAKGAYDICSYGTPTGLQRGSGWLPKALCLWAMSHSQTVLQSSPTKKHSQPMGNIYAEDLTARCPGLVFNIQFDFLEPTCRNFFFHVFDEEKYLRQTPLRP